MGAQRSLGAWFSASHVQCAMYACTATAEGALAAEKGLERKERDGWQWASHDSRTRVPLDLLSTAVCSRETAKCRRSTAARFHPQTRLPHRSSPPAQHAGSDDPHGGPFGGQVRRRRWLHARALPRHLHWAVSGSQPPHPRCFPLCRLQRPLSSKLATPAGLTPLGGKGGSPLGRRRWRVAAVTAGQPPPGFCSTVSPCLLAW